MAQSKPLTVAAIERKVRAMLAEASKARGEAAGKNWGLYQCCGASEETLKEVLAFIKERK